MLQCVPLFCNLSKNGIKIFCEIRSSFYIFNDQHILRWTSVLQNTEFYGLKEANARLTLILNKIGRQNVC